jgi:hypothetical protein
MIQFSPLVQQALQSTTEGFYLVKVTKGPTVLFAATSYNRDLTLSDGVLHPANDRLQGVDAPSVSTTIDRQIYKVAISDPEFEYGDLIKIGSMLEVRLGFLNPITNIPMTLLSDTALVYKGRVSDVRYEIEAATEGDVTLIVAGASPMLNLARKSNFLFNKEAVRARNPADSSADALFQGSGAALLKWGKT